MYVISLRLVVINFDFRQDNSWAYRTRLWRSCPRSFLFSTLVSIVKLNRSNRVMAEISADASAPADWYKPCSEEHLAEIAAVVTEWREISPFLGITEAEEHEILGSAPHSVLSQKIALLRLWKKKRGRAATYDQLSRVFRKCERLDLEETLKQILEDSEVVYGGPSSNPSPRSDPLIPYASYLKELYLSMFHSRTSQHWSHLPRCEFIQLAMIKGEEVRRGGPDEEMIRLAQQGKIETILCNKESIDLHNLFPFPPQSPQPLVVLPPPPPGRVCLIEGAPGAGKSTLALHICHEWAQDAPWLVRFDTVVLVYLRDEAVQNASTLADILPARDIEMSQSIASQLQAADGNNVLFIFDGWDEFPSSLMNKSLVSTIIRQPHKLSLHRSTVLITSRPVASGSLLQIADRRVEILGFTQHQIREYIEKALDGNSSLIQKLVQHLNKYPIIEGYCYIPLHSAILVHIFLTMGALPTTLHELFCSLVLCCIVREHKTHKRDTSRRFPDISSLDDLPDYLKATFSDHCLLAYNGIMNDNVVFHSKDLQKSNLSNELGLLQAVEGLTLTSKSCSFNFLHLSVQELLAAKYISQMPTSEQVEVFKSLFASSRFQAVLNYYSGFTKLINPEIREFIISYHRKSNLKELLPLLHCFFEAHDPSLCLLVDPKFRSAIELNFASIHDPSDYLAIGYFVASLLSTLTADLPPVQLLIRRKYTDASLYYLKLLLSEISKYAAHPAVDQSCGLSIEIVNTSHLGLLNPEGNFFAKQEAEVIAAHLGTSSAISELFLHNGLLQDRLLNIAEALQKNNTLTKLCLVDDDLRAQNGSVLFEMLRVNKSLKYLDLSHNCFLNSAAHCCIFEGLRYNTTLTQLILRNSGVDVSNPDTARSLTTMLQENKSLTHLDIFNNGAFSRRGASCIFNGLQFNTTLTHLSISGDYMIRGEDDPDRVKSLAQMLQVNKSLTYLDLSYIMGFSESEARCIFESLHRNVSLVSLNLNHTDLTATNPDTAKSLTTMLRENKSLTHLDLSMNTSLSDSGACCIFKGLKHNTSLVSLNLAEIGMTTKDPLKRFKSLTKMLKVNKTLTHLNLSNNSYGCCESLSIISNIFQGLQQNTTLLELGINYMTITDGDAECIAQAMRCNRCLHTLHMRLPFISYEGFSCILDSLIFNTSLKVLYLSGMFEPMKRLVQDFKFARQNSEQPSISIIFPDD